MSQADSKNSSGQEQQQTAQTALYPSPYPQQFEDDTIDLYKLWITLWNRKWLVIAVAVVAALGSVVYALQQQHIYKAQALLLPPKAKDIQSINPPRRQFTLDRQVEPVIVKITSKDAFNKFKQNLKIRALHKKFIHENGLMELLSPNRTPETRDEDIYQGFSELIILEDVKGTTSLSIELHDAEIAAQWVNDFIEFVDKETIAMLVEDLQNSIANQINDIEYTIESKRQMVKQRREDQIMEIELTIKSKRYMVKQRREDQIMEIQRSINSKREMATLRRKDKILRYEEAAKTAKSLGIMTNLTQHTKLVESTSEGVSPITSRDKLMGSPIAHMNVDISTATTPLFFIGYDALFAELNNLNSRTNEDPFIPGLRDLQEQLSLLKSIETEDPFIDGLRDLQEQLSLLKSIDTEDSFIDGLRDLQEQLVLLRSIKFNQEKITSVHIDQAAYPTNSPIKPNRRAIVSLATVVGLFSGIFLVFFIEFVQNQRKKNSE